MLPRATQRAHASCHAERSEASNSGGSTPNPDGPALRLPGTGPFGGFDFMVHVVEARHRRDAEAQAAASATMAE